MNDAEKIKLKNCTVTPDGVFCDMDQENHQKMTEQKIIPNDLTISLEKETLKNKTSDGAKPTEADSSNKQGCECFKTTENSEIANYVAKFLTKNEEN